MTENNPGQPPPPRMNVDGREFWEGTAQQRLLLKMCSDCGRKHYPPRYLCPHCWSAAFEWVQSAGRGKVYSYTVMHRAPTASFSDQVPYVLALVDLAEGPRLMTNIVGPGALDVRIGDAVSVVFEDRQGVKVPQFTVEDPPRDPSRRTA